ncbi:hypothetical protein ACFLXH_05235 [Chloroflexota bacterium]
MNKKEKGKQTQIDRESYGKFIRQVDIGNIRLISANIKLLDHDYFPEETEVRTRFRTDYENTKDGFCYLHHLRTLIKDRPTKVNKAQIYIAIRVDYTSKIAMNEEFNEIFIKRNLFVNTWPYFREIANSFTTRFGWPPYITPVYKA